jgi:hypothetical protein
LKSGRRRPIRWFLSRLPRDGAQLEAGIREALRLVFWVLILAPVVIVPLVYLTLAVLH